MSWFSRGTTVETPVMKEILCGFCDEVLTYYESAYGYPTGGTYSGHECKQYKTWKLRRKPLGELTLDDCEFLGIDLPTLLGTPNPSFGATAEEKQ